MEPTSPPPAPDEALAFVHLILRVGFVLTSLLSDLVEEIPEDAFPGEHPGEVLIEMVAGSVRPVVDAAGPVTVHGAGALLEAIVDRTLEDLRQAVELARMPGSGRLD